MLDPKVVAIRQIADGTHPFDPSWTCADWMLEKEIIDSADVLVQGNMLGQKRRKLNGMYLYIINSGKPWIVLETAVFRNRMKPYPDPDAYHRYGWFSYYWDEAEYNNWASPPDRWERVQKEQRLKIKPWKKDGDYILLLMQRPGDSSLKRAMDKHIKYENWIVSVLEEIRANTDRPIVARLHPLRQDRQLKILESEKDRIGNLELTGVTRTLATGNQLYGGQSLYKDFAKAWAVVGYNSNALTESVCEGIPTFSLDSSSMAWPVSNRYLSDLDNPRRDIHRSQWLWDLAYAQWTETEVANGQMWEHLGQLWPTIKQTRLDRPDWEAISAEKTKCYQENYIDYWVEQAKTNQL